MPHSVQRPRADLATQAELTVRPLRYAYLLFGVLCLGLGVAGYILPMMPGTVFMIMALWAFSRSCPHIHDWLYHHPRFGLSLRQWRDHRVIPPKAKVLALGSMVLSLGITATTTGMSEKGLTLLLLLLTAVAVFILLQPIAPPDHK